MGANTLPENKGNQELTFHLGAVGLCKMEIDHFKEFR